MDSPGGSPEAPEQGLEDARDVALVLAGDTKAFDRLIERYQRRAVAVAYRLLNNLEDAMDVCQEAFLKSYRSLETLREPQRFGSWLLRIVGNLSLNYRRGRKPMLSIHAGEEAGELESSIGQMQPRTGEGDPTSVLHGAEVEKSVNAAIEALPEKQRAALILFAVEKMPQKEVAEILECSVESVKWYVFQARKTLKEKLADLLEE